jgi:cellulose synthase (UDP-forming)
VVRAATGGSKPDARPTSERVFVTADYWAHAVLSLAATVALIVFSAYWFTQGDWSRTPVVFCLLTLPLLTGIAMYASRWLTLPLMRKPVHRPPRPGWRVGVATTFVPSSEPVDMLERAVEALIAMDYPHETWVLDEGDDPEVAALCGRLGARHFSRKGRAEYLTESGHFERRTKHGNYNAWLDAVGHDRYDLVVNFDPDHVAQRDYLTRTLGYFDFPKVGYVQPAQVYYNQAASFVARGAAEETYHYYSSVQMTSYALGYPIVTGCHTAQRVTALQDVGGFAAHEADDLLITMYYRASGWHGVYVPEVLAQGLTPVDWDGYLTQQRRWARSVLDVKFRIYRKVAARLPRVERLTSLAHGLYYLHGLASALGVAVLSHLLVAGQAPAVLDVRTVPYVLVVMAALAACEVFRQRFFLRPSERGLHWRAGLLRIAKWPTVLIALLDSLHPRDWQYSITRKSGEAASSRLLVLPHTAVVALLTGSCVLGFARGHSPAPAVLVAALAIAVQSSALLLTTLLRFSRPYDPALRPDAMHERSGTASK